MNRLDLDRDYVGRRFGKWTAVEVCEREISGRVRRALRCRCDCGTELVILPTALRLGQTKECRACNNRNGSRKPRLTHGKSSTRLFNIHSQMKRRCGKPNHQDYHRYGGRGITVCAEWMAFEPFHDWAVSNGYQPDLTIDRRDNDRGYEPGNCHWITRAAQNRNRRDNHRYDWRGERLILSEIAERTGISSDLLRRRIYRDNWDLERAATTPARPINRSARS